jgi:hypothetical protein
MNCFAVAAKAAGMSMIQSRPFAHLGRMALVMLIATFASRHR